MPQNVYERILYCDALTDQEKQAICAELDPDKAKSEMCICTAFTWMNTSQGYAFWAKLHDDHLRICNFSVRRYLANGD